jgi:cytochrome b561
VAAAPAPDAAPAWGRPARLLHWLVAALVAAMLVLGVVMVEVVEDLGAKFRLYQLHKSLGLTVLALVLLRLAWRLASPAPPRPPTVRPWEAAAARAVHALLYLLLLATPVAGFLMAASAPIGIPTVLFGVVTVPHPVGPDEARFELLKDVHGTLATLLLALAALHAAAALRHHLLLGDDVLLRMLPPAWRPRLDRWRLRRAAG